MSGELDIREELLEDSPFGGGIIHASSPCMRVGPCVPLTILDDTVEEVALLCVLRNQCGKPCLRLKPPGGRRSSSVALTVSKLEDPVV